VLFFGMVAGFFFFSNPHAHLVAQGSEKQPKLSCPEKWWAVCHLFVAKRAYQATLHSLSTTDSIRQSGLLDGDSNGGQTDAFKHACWMAAVSLEVGWRKARRLGRAHEKGNYRSFKKSQRKGIPDTHDKAASNMDLWNNRQGIDIALAYPDASRQNLSEIIIRAIENGKMKIVQKNADGQFLDVEGRVIPHEDLTGKWENGKVLVPSDQVR